MKLYGAESAFFVTFYGVILENLLIEKSNDFSSESEILLACWWWWSIDFLHSIFLPGSCVLAHIETSFSFPEENKKAIEAQT